MRQVWRCETGTEHVQLRAKLVLSAGGKKLGWPAERGHGQHCVCVRACGRKVPASRYSSRMTSVHAIVDALPPARTHTAESARHIALGLEFWG
eukprot:1227769-Rhodomonas_salina.1